MAVSYLFLFISFFLNDNISGKNMEKLVYVW